MKTSLLSLCLYVSLLASSATAQISHSDSSFSKLNFGLLLGGNELFDSYSNGIGPSMALRVRYNLTPSLALGLSGLAYRTGPAIKDFGPGILNYETVGSTNIAFNLFGQYNILPSSAFNPYLFLGGTMHLPGAIAAPSNIALRGVSLEGPVRASYLDNSTLFGALAGLGTEVFLSKKFSIDLSASYSYMFGNSLSTVGYKSIFSDGRPNEKDDANSGLLMFMLGFNLYLDASESKKAVDNAVAVVTPRPTVELKVTPPQGEAGTSVTITWNTSNADSVILNGERVAPAGSREERLTQSKTYTLKAFGKGGDAMSSASAAISQIPAPAVAFIVKPDTVTAGEPVSISWNTSNATEVTLNGQKVPPSGNRVERPKEKTPYTLIAKGPGGTVQKSGTVYVKSIENINVGEKLEMTIKFLPGSARIDPEEFPRLDEIAEKLLARPKLEVEISGHTDNTGTAKTNNKLSLDRAIAVQKYLTGKKVMTSRLRVRGAGDREPIGDNTTDEGRALNRRIEMKVIKE